MTGSDDDVLRLTAVIEHQRRALDRIRAAAAGESVVAMARGALMERLGLSSVEAASQLAELSAATGVPLAEMAAAVLSPDASAAADGLRRRGPLARRLRGTRQAAPGNRTAWLRRPTARRLRGAGRPGRAGGGPRRNGARLAADPGRR